MEEKKFDLIEEMTKSVEKKLSEIRSIVPVILTVVTALIAFFSTGSIIDLPLISIFTVFLIYGHASYKL